MVAICTSIDGHNPRMLAYLAFPLDRTGCRYLEHGLPLSQWVVRAVASNVPAAGARVQLCSAWQSRVVQRSASFGQHGESSSVVHHPLHRPMMSQSPVLVPLSAYHGKL